MSREVSVKYVHQEGGPLCSYIVKLLPGIHRQKGTHTTWFLFIPEHRKYRTFSGNFINSRYYLVYLVELRDPSQNYFVGLSLVGLSLVPITCPYQCGIYWCLFYHRWRQRRMPSVRFGNGTFVHAARLCSQPREVACSTLSKAYFPLGC